MSRQDRKEGNGGAWRVLVSIEEMWVTGEREQRDHLMTTSTSVTHLHIVSLIFLRHPATHTHTRCLQAPGRHTLIYSGLQAQCNQRDMSTFIYSLFSL